MIETLSTDELSLLRLLYGTQPLRILPDDPEDDAFLAMCSDNALLQIANGGIRTLSLSAIVACWKRGLRPALKR